MKDIYADILTIGDEILYGQITDTNSQWISGELDKIGIRIRRKSSVGDNIQEILTALTEAERRSDIILITGGLGPTNDDITKNTLCSYFGSELVLNEDALQEVTRFFEKRGRTLTEINRQQAYLPKACTYIPNISGTAPGMWFERNGKIFMSMPGVPFEMKEIMTREVIPRLKVQFKTPVIYHKVIRTVGIGESFLAEKIATWEASLPAHLKLAYLPSYSEVKLRLTATGDDRDNLIKEVNDQIQKLIPLLSDYIFGFDEDTLEKVIGRLLIKNGKNLAIAESCTGGFASYSITSIPGSSAYLLGSVVAYHNDIKQEVLGVKGSTLQSFGAVSEETALEMATGIRLKFNSDIGLSVTGIAGPDGGTVDKPVGTVWIAYSDSNKSIAKKLTLGNLRDVNVKLSTIALFNLLRQNLITGSL